MELTTERTELPIAEVVDRSNALLHGLTAMRTIDTALATLRLLDGMAQMLPSLESARMNQVPSLSVPTIIRNEVHKCVKMIITYVGSMHTGNDRPKLFALLRIQPRDTSDLFTLAELNGTKWVLPKSVHPTPYDPGYLCARWDDNRDPTPLQVARALNVPLQ